MKLQRFTLPSGARVELDAAEPIALDGVFGAELRGVRAQFRQSDGRSARLQELPLSDLHTLRAILRRLGRIEEKPLTIVCENCDRAFDVMPSSTLEIGPFRDAELNDPELDAGFAFDELHEIPALASDEGLSRVRLEPRRVVDLLPLHAVLAPDRPLRITSRVVTALGVAEIDTETDPRRIARMLQSASDEAFAELGALFEQAHYPPRLDVAHPCPDCGALEWLCVPLSRELSLESPEGEATITARSGALPGFPDVDEFEGLVRSEAERAYRDLGIGAVALTIIEDAAEVDDGGEPLLGCYRPADPDALIPKSAEIRLFYRTFVNMQRSDGPYDVRAEIAETLRHELTHHLDFLAGDDPVDDREQMEIVVERLRRVGKTETSRRTTRHVRTELSAFFARTWFVWLLVAAATLLALLADRR